MTIHPTVDLGKAFDKLKAGLKECEAVIDDKEQFPEMMDRFAKAHGWLLAHVTHFIRTVEQPDPFADDKAYENMQERKEFADRLNNHDEN